MGAKIRSKLDSQTRKLLEAAIRAPSGDNCQPWSFQVQEDGSIAIYIVADRALSLFDYRTRATLLSVGTVVENMRIQAEADERGIDVSYCDNNDPEGPVAVVRLRSDAPGLEAPERVAAMNSRTVNRRPFLPIPPARRKLDALLGKPIEGVKITLIDRRLDIFQWARLVYLADRIRYSHPVIHHELFSKILFTNEQVQEHRIGLEIKRLGAGPAAGQIMRFIQPWERMKRLQRYGVDRLLANHSRFLALASGALILVSIEGNTRVGWMNAGEQVERLWVDAEQQGLCVHPMTVVLYLHQRFRQEGMENFLGRHRPLLEEIDESLSRLLGDRTGVMLFRLGYGWRMKDTAVRLPLESFLD